jgi:2Fe-2S ferredoxin
MGQIMPKIQFAKGQKPIDVQVGSNLMKALLAAGVPVASSCRGEGVCGKCRIEVLAGRNHLSQPNETEIFLCEKYQLTQQQRISCQAKVLGDIKIDTTYW